MSESRPTIVYTLTDEAPALATRSLLPIVQAFADAADVRVETRDISLAARILARFDDRLSAEQRVPDALAELGELAGTERANIVKLPNISASAPQMKAAIAELQGQGFDLPDYPDEPADDAEREVRTRYDAVKGSAVNPVLREGNSDRRAPAAVKNNARANPHSMGAWSPDSASHVSHMDAGDFRANELSTTLAEATAARIEHVAPDGEVTVMKPEVALEAGEILDATFMSRRALDDFLAHEIRDARERGVLFSLHLKATMMKVSDPILFGRAVRAYLPGLFEEFGDEIRRAGGDPASGLGGVVAAIETLPEERREAARAHLADALAQGPGLAMVDSDRGITNLHVPSDVIVDASMPAMIRAGGQMWDRDGRLRDTKAVIPDGSYAPVYAETVDHCREHGAFDPATMGTVPNVGLMAQKAEEYGSHDKTFEVPADGTMRIVDASSGDTLLEHAVETGDVWRACTVRDAPVRDWVRLAVARARATGAPAVFWLDESRAHDAELLAKVRNYLAEHDTEGLRIEILAPREATRLTLERLRAGDDTISVTGNVLRDYLTDLFPILELGTSAKMLSIVPLMNGGGLFETGAGGSAPKHVQQLVRENHLRWDSLGEFLALAVSLEHLADVADEPRARALASALDAATERLLSENRSPSRRVGELDNRGSHFYLALYWAEALAGQSDDPSLAKDFTALAERLRAEEETIVTELNAVQGEPVDIGGYYYPDVDKCVAVMRPSETFNATLASLAPAA